MRKLLTICLGNYCRSPFAQVALTRRGGANVTVRSAGLIGKWQDQPANPSMTTAVRRLGYDLTGHRAQQITLKMLDWADDILAMDASVLATLRAICDVPDPMGQDEGAFHDCAVLIEVGTTLHTGGRSA